MYQLIPIISGLNIGQGGYDRGPQIFTLHATEDLIIRGMMSQSQTGSGAAAVKLFVGGSEGQLDGDKMLDSNGTEFCYNFIPLEMPVAQDDLIKINHSAGKGIFSLLTDKAVDLRRLYDDFVSNKIDWSGDTPDYETENGGYGDFSGISNACYYAWGHQDILVRCRVQLHYPTYPSTQVHSVLGVRSDQDGQNRYAFEVETYYNGGTYMRGPVIAKYVSGSRTVIADGRYNGGGGSQDEWLDVVFGVSGNRFIMTCYGTTFQNDDSSIADGDYLFIPTGNNLKIAQLDIY